LDPTRSTSLPSPPPPTVVSPDDTTLSPLNASSARRRATRSRTPFFSRHFLTMSDAAAFSLTCGQMEMGW